MASADPSPRRTILIVEDEQGLRQTLARHLEREGYAVLTAARGDDALQIARERNPDLILLDLMLPGLDGIQVCRLLRRNSQVPILMLTALGGESDKVVGLDSGADDYLAKPFGLRELSARIRALLRRRPATDAGVPEVVRSGDLEAFPLRREIRRNGVPLRLKPKEYDLLLFFMRNPGRVFTRDQLLQDVWGHEYLGGERTVDVHVRWLRQKIEPDPSSPSRIRTVRGSGYIFEG